MFTPIPGEDEPIWAKNQKFQRGCFNHQPDLFAKLAGFFFTTEVR